LQRSCRALTSTFAVVARRPIAGRRRHRPAGQASRATNGPATERPDGAGMRSIRTTAAIVVLAVAGFGAAPTLADGSSQAPATEPAPEAPAVAVEAADPAEPEVPVPAAPPAAPPAPLHPQPPVDGRDAPDPFVLRAGDLWLVFSTQAGPHNVPVAVSTDLAAWYPAADAMPTLPSWAAWGRTWAPGVVELGGRFVLYFAAHHAESGRQCIGLATSSLPYGPFTPIGDRPLVCQLDQGGSIDPYPFVAPSGEAFLLWKADGNAVGIASRLYAQPLAADGLSLAGEPVELLRSGSAWERPLIENPAMTVVDGQFVLLYSGGWWESDGYATGYATCASPLGPCTKVTVDGPVHRGRPEEAGPGGAAAFQGPAGDRWVVYHAWSAGRVGYGNGGVRSLRFAPVGWGAGGLAIGA
jgi:hypothetical protein